MKCLEIRMNQSFAKLLVTIFDKQNKQCVLMKNESSLLPISDLGENIFEDFVRVASFAQKPMF